MQSTGSDMTPIRHTSLRLGLMAVTIFVSAFLLFQVQPLISKLILPWFGGSPTVWTTAMLFFQCALFAGYAYAHVMTRYVSFKTHLRVHILLLCISAVLSILITPRDFLKPNGDENPALRILLLLFVCVGVPYFTLASTGPLIQAWFSKSFPNHSPYRLYSLSNAGSFLALLTFPYVFEPWLELPQLGQAWTSIYWIFAALCAVTAGILYFNATSEQSSRMAESTATEDESAKIPPHWMQRVCWIALPAIASLTMIAATDHVSHNVAPEPRLWITSLALYLLTFIITFDHERWYRRGFTAIACLAAILFLTCRSQLLDMVHFEWDFGVSELRWSHFVVMFLICFLCHGELVRLRPKATYYLTEFYLCISIGGACGGLFASLIAVNFFNDYYEWPLCLVMAIALSLTILASLTILRSDQLASPPSRRWWVAGVSVCFALGWIGFWMDPFDWQAEQSKEYKTQVRFAGRNFYGTISVEDRTNLKDASQSYRGFYSGNVTHGMQLTDPASHLKPVSYYGADTGAGETIAYAQSRQNSIRMAVVGLGAGSLASYGRPTDFIDFYEINPEVIRVAQEHFSFLKECKSTTKIILGDGRLKIDASKESPYDIILLDAFTGGSVPVHLLTKEAFAMYRRHLTDDGFIVVHITNAYLNLYPVAKLQAESLHMGYQSKFMPADWDHFTRRNQYITLTNDQKFLASHPSVYPPSINAGSLAERKEPNLTGVSLWTDHFSSINPIERHD